jgi:hypothetical protein
MTLSSAGLLILGLAACPASTLMHTARPIQPGSNEIGINLVATGFGVKTADVDLATGEVTEDTKQVIGPGVEFQFRHGINEQMDFGLKYTTLSPLALSFDFNFAFINTGSFALSVDPMISPMYFSAGDGSVFMMYAYLPIIADVISTDSLVLSVNARGAMAYGVISGAVDSDNSLTVDGADFGAGGGIGVKFKLGETFALMPEFQGVYWFDIETFVWTGAVGFLF